MGIDEAHKAWPQNLVQLQLKPPRRPDVDHKAVRASNRRYVEQTMQEDEPDDVFQVNCRLNQQQWKACHVLCRTTSQPKEEHRTGHERSSTEPIRCRRSSNLLALVIVLIAVHQCVYNKLCTSNYWSCCAEDVFFILSFLLQFIVATKASSVRGRFTEVKQRRPRLVLGWVTVREDRALWICVRSSVWT